MQNFPSAWDLAEATRKEIPALRRSQAYGNFNRGRYRRIYSGSGAQKSCQHLSPVQIGAKEAQNILHRNGFSQPDAAYAR